MVLMSLKYMIIVSLVCYNLKNYIFSFNQNQNFIKKTPFIIFSFSLILYEQCPAQIRSHYLADFVGISTLRLVKRCFLSGFGPLVIQKTKSIYQPYFNFFFGSVLLYFLF